MYSSSGVGCVALVTQGGTILLSLGRSLLEGRGKDPRRFDRGADACVREKGGGYGAKGECGACGKLLWVGVACVVAVCVVCARGMGEGRRERAMTAMGQIYDRRPRSKAWRPLFSR